MPEIRPDKWGVKGRKPPLTAHEVEYKAGIESPTPAAPATKPKAAPEHSGFGLDQFRGVKPETMKKILTPAVSKWAMTNAAQHVDKFMKQHGYTDRAAATQHLALIFLRAGLLHRQAQKTNNQLWTESLFTHPTSGKWFTVRVAQPQQPVVRSAPRVQLARDKEWIKAKIRKIMKEGVRGKKVSPEQAVAIAHSMARKQKLSRWWSLKKKPTLNEHDSLIDSASQQAHNGEHTPMLLLADHLQEHGLPGAELLRHSYAAKTQQGEFSHPQLAWRGTHAPSWKLPGGLTLNIESVPIDASGENTKPWLAAHHETDARANMFGFDYPLVQYSHYQPIYSLRHWLEMSKDLPTETREAVFNYLRDHHGDEIPKATADRTLDGPVRLARMTAGKAGIAAKSQNHEKRIEVARQVLKEAGLTPSIVRAVVAHDANQSRPSAVQIVQKQASPEHTRYAAAWYGLLSGERNLAVFHPDDRGEDFLHVISSPHPTEFVANRLRKSGIPRFVSESKEGGGSRFYVFNPLGKLDVDGVASMIPDANHTTIRGSGYRLGAGASTSANGSATGRSDTEASARANYRNVISDFERAAGA